MTLTDGLQQVIVSLGDDIAAPTDTQPWREAAESLRSLASMPTASDTQKTVLMDAAARFDAGPLTNDALTTDLVTLTRMASYPDSDTALSTPENIPEPGAIRALAEVLRDELHTVIDELDLYHRPDVVPATTLEDITSRIRSLLKPLPLLQLAMSERLPTTLDELPKSNSTSERRERQFVIASDLLRLQAQLGDMAVSGLVPNNALEQAVPDPAEVQQARRTLADELIMEAPDAAQRAFC